MSTVVSDIDVHSGLKVPNPEVIFPILEIGSFKLSWHVPKIAIGCS